MITRNTVLILGAGASMPFGYPSGISLVKTVVEKIRTNEWTGLLLELGFAAEEIENFRNSLARSGRTSIDAFIEHRTEFMRIRKAAIARALVPYEAEPRLFELNAETNWYLYLYGKMAAPWEEFGSNKLSVITFNYDRSIEHFLFTSLKNSYGKSDEQCTSVMRTVPIVHVHGQLGYVPWQGEHGRPYEPSFSIRDLEIATNRIKIISEDIIEDPEFAQAHTLIQNAQKIYFLGFGYNNTNMNRLRPDLLKRKAVWGTCYNLGIAEIEELKTRWRFLRLAAPAYDIMGFLKNEGTISWQRPSSLQMCGNGHMKRRDFIESTLVVSAAMQITNFKSQVRAHRSTTRNLHCSRCGSHSLRTSRLRFRPVMRASFV
jgi:hypothetical protein